MHKAIMLMVEAENREEAKEKAEHFLEENKNDVWDWYCIGGRWSGTLNKNCKKFFEEVDKKYPVKKDDYGRSYQFIEEHQVEFQAIWTGLGETSENPYSRDTFITHDYEATYPDDILPLSKCITIVRDWQQKPEDGLKEIEKAKRWLKPTNKKDDYNMYGYCLKCASYILQEDFSFETNIFNTEDFDFSIPKKLSGWYVVMVDMHN